MGAVDWKREVDKEIEKLLETPPSVQGAEKLAAFFIISEKLNAEDVNNANKNIREFREENPEPRTLADVIDYIPNSKIDDYIQQKLINFLRYTEEKTLEMQTGEELHGVNAENALKQMLCYDLQIGELMLKSADEGERLIIRETFMKLAAL